MWSGVTADTAPGSHDQAAKGTVPHLDHGRNAGAAVSHVLHLLWVHRGRHRVGGHPCAQPRHTHTDVQHTRAPVHGATRLTTDTILHNQAHTPTSTQCKHSVTTPRHVLDFRTTVPPLTKGALRPVWTGELPPTPGLGRGSAAAVDLASAGGAFALLYSWGSTMRQGSMHTAAMRPARMRPMASLDLRPSNKAVTHMEVNTMHASTCVGVGCRECGSEGGSGGQGVSTDEECEWVWRNHGWGCAELQGQGTGDANEGR
jgi:hypothetical protein